MKKTGFLILLLLILQHVQAQKLNKEDVKSFKTVALTINNTIARTLIIRKWTTPIYYKIYGTENPVYDKMVQQEAASAFKQIKQLTGLQIQPVMGDDSVNFSIIIARADKLGDVLAGEILNYFKAKKGSQIYYSTNHESISQVTTLIDPKQYSERQHVHTIIQIQIASAMGLFGKLTNIDNSLFSATPGVLPINFKAADALKIKTLYNPKILHEMKEKELDEVLKEL